MPEFVLRDFVRTFAGNDVLLYLGGVAVLLYALAFRLSREYR